MRSFKTLTAAVATLVGLTANPVFAFGGGDGDVIVHLFEWRWPDVALECERFLGPKGYAAVQVSPPNEHAVVIGRPWYERYQPVSYTLVSRSGDEAEFREMVQRCRDAGVEILVDAVVNHMAGHPKDHLHRFGTAGTPYSTYEYPGTYGPYDFHYCGRPISNYQDRWEVQNCELFTLADLKTESEYVRSRIARYFNDLWDIGVRALRIDGAKHMPAKDLEAIFAKVPHDFYVFAEVVDYGNEPIKGEEYYRIGDVTEFRYGLELARVFYHGNLAWLRTFGEEWGLRPGEHALVFLDNHDTQRGHGGGGEVLTHKDSAVYALANVFMLAHPYGNPKVMSSYGFWDAFQGPPAHPSGETKRIWVGDQAQCFGEWICEHRWLAIANMVRFRKVTVGEPVTHWWSNGNDQIAFGRGGKGFVVLNREGWTMERVFDTGLPAGLYCNVTVGDYLPDENRCTGEVVEVDETGRASIRVTPIASVALHVEARIK